MGSVTYRWFNRAMFTLCLAGWAWPVVCWLTSDALRLLLPACPSRVWLQIPCPLCGLTRAFMALYQGHWQTAVQHHPWAPIFAAILLAETLFRAVLSIHFHVLNESRLFTIRRLDGRVHAFLFAVYLAYAIIRFSSFAMAGVSGNP
ncbi:MAG: hypothetical protein A2498_16585 [Lentisphaerae bacterium RIFOXYC12_FULL_60_16]|nr:MAG: hypothetical protein A2498_16585 [Lentisphaerae bacterium RIFOXYC12_FULL_60_16]OGV85662.1 MAG: hypothetical protein A2340_13950 [Lentisphaerae bacterium RIFOXYB12_FULL_60_10]